MGLLEDILARASMPANPALFPVLDPGMEGYGEAASRSALDLDPYSSVTRKPKNKFPDVPVVAPVAPIATMAPQAGLLAPTIGQLGQLSAQPAAPAPDADPAAIPAGEPVPLPVPRPDIPPATDLSSSNRPTSLISPAQHQALAEVAPTIAGGAPPPTTAMPTSPFGASSILDRITSGLGSRSNTLLALAAGFAGAPNIGQGISRAAAAAIPARAADIKEQLTTQNQRITTAALVKAGVPLQMAIAAQANPELMKKVADSYLIDRKNEIKEVKTKDAFGNETSRLVAVNPYDLTTKELAPVGGGAGGGTGARAGTGATMFAPGVTELDPTKVGQDYLAQFSPEVQAGVKAYMRGDSLPTGRQQLAQTIKTIAQKYGDDVGMPANDQLYAQRKTFANSLGDTKSGVGMQVKGFQQGLQHAVELSDKLVKLGNYNGLGSEDLANVANAVKNRTTGQQDIARGITVSSQALAGEVGKLFSGSSGGGVHERQTTQQMLGNTSMSGPAAAGALESTIELMEGGLRTLEQRRDELFPGGEKPRGGDFRGKAEEQAIEHIRKNIAILRGQQQADAAAAASPAAKTLPPGAYVWSPDKGLVPR